MSACVHRDMKHAGNLESTKDAFASYLDERTDDV